MFTLIHDNLLLLLGTFLALFATSLKFYKNPVIASFGDYKRHHNLISFLKQPQTVWILAIRHHRRAFLFLSTIFFLLLFVASFILFNVTLPAPRSLVFALPSAILIFYLLYELLWLCTFLLHYLIDVGNAKFNLIFSLNTIQLLLIYFSLPKDGQISGFTFILAFINLALCYLLTASALKMVLNNILRHMPAFTHHNLWKVALTLLVEFFCELTMLCYIGSCYFPAAYNIPVSLFDTFYFVVITFGTIGYGDITPTCVYTRCISILITFTSIACISIMLSSFLSVSKNDKINKA